MPSKDLCPRFEAAMELVARRWTPLIVQQLSSGPRRYSELSAAIPALSERVLSERLKELEGAGVVVREVIPELPLRVEYSLTPKGRALAAALGPLEAWAERWVEPPRGKGRPLRTAQEPSAAVRRRARSRT